MILQNEKEYQKALQIAIATALGCWGFPLIALLLILLILPWPPIYRMTAHFGGVVLEIKAQRTVKRAMRKLNEEPVHVS